jgi:hypothetical protein
MVCEQMTPRREPNRRVAEASECTLVLVEVIRRPAYLAVDPDARRLFRIPLSGRLIADEPTQVTPKGAAIPVPTREQVLSDFEKAVQPVHEQTFKFEVTPPGETRTHESAKTTPGGAFSFHARWLSAARGI